MVFQDSGLGHRFWEEAVVPNCMPSRVVVGRKCLHPSRPIHQCYWQERASSMPFYCYWQAFEGGKGGTREFGRKLPLTPLVD